MGQQFSWEEAEAAGEMDVAELQEWYKKFVVECPSGTLFMHEFKRFFKVTGNEEATQYVEGMFRAFDKNGVRSPPCRGLVTSAPGALPVREPSEWDPPCPAPFLSRHSPDSSLSHHVSLSLLLLGSLHPLPESRGSLAHSLGLPWAF